MKTERRSFLKWLGLLAGGTFFVRRSSPLLYAQPDGAQRGKTYFIDPLLGSDANSGLTHLEPLKTYHTREFVGGDHVLFKRGSIIRDNLHTRDGEKKFPITYGAYGEGEKPVFMGSVAIGDPRKWIEVQPLIWQYQGEFATKVCNLVFNGGERCGNLRWAANALKEPGEWHYTGNASGDRGGGQAPPKSVLLLYASTNPGIFYQSIECVLWGERRMVKGKAYIVLENLSFRNSGVHGYQQGQAHDLVIRACDFSFIGGAVWDNERRIRFGNAIELWDGARDITVEYCNFDNIYDAGVTHQGGETRHIPERLYFRYNYFNRCGFAAYECREPSQDVYFEYNVSINAGGGFSLQGEAPPRQSEIYPQPVGHHVFIWRIDPHTQPGKVYIRHNTFSEAPYGAAVYSIISPADEEKFILDHNSYKQTRGDVLITMGGRAYRPSEFKIYQTECRQDLHSQLTQS